MLRESAFSSKLRNAGLCEKFLICVWILFILRGYLVLNIATAVTAVVTLLCTVSIFSNGIMGVIKRHPLRFSWIFL